ncbi:hypothetical protein GCM10027064_17950 [Microbacterium petrolearium]
MPPRPTADSKAHSLSSSAAVRQRTVRRTGTRPLAAAASITRETSARDSSGERSGSPAERTTDGGRAWIAAIVRPMDVAAPSPGGISAASIW